LSNEGHNPYLTAMFAGASVGGEQDHTWNNSKGHILEGNGLGQSLTLMGKSKCYILGRFG
jgi:hypothetical protein